jgi:hypothetical protein
MARIVAVIAPDGTTTFKVEGIAGPSCRDLTASLEKALGKTVNDRKTAEFYESEGASRSEVSE